MSTEHKTLTYDGKVIFEKVAFDSFKRGPKNFNEKEACFMFVQEGAIELRTPDDNLSFHSGEAMLAKCGNYFFEQPARERHAGNFRTRVIGIYLYPTVIKEIFDFDFSKSTHETSYASTRVNMDGLMENFRTGIEFLIDNPSVVDDELIKTKLKEFVLLLSKTENAPSLQDFAASLFKPRECDFKTTVENNIYSSLSIDEFARLTSTSVATFKRKFTSIYEVSPGKYLAQRKVEKSLKMLKSSEELVVNIAYDCGFENISTFNRCFKKQVGISPSEYRLSQIAH
ncbi:MAG: AraC-like DNA-binding protein [Flavobacteriales bacterium]|jgi:AraC-like DNA-binding protein